jgi:hypothetical protein
MARRTVFVSDFSGKEIGDPKEAVRITVAYADGRKGTVVADAHPSDSVVKEIEKAGTTQARRGRKPKAG